MQAPLTGVKVVEFAGLGPCPCAGMMLADMGAEVILIERADHKTPFPRKAEIYHRGKKSVALDLKNPLHIQAARTIVENSDILLEGFRPGVMERLGLSPQSFEESNPKLVYGRLTGWGQTGPLAQAAGHEPNYMSLAGSMWYGGRIREQNTSSSNTSSNIAPPSAPLTIAGDFGSGMMLVSGVLAAYIGAQNSGKGQVVDAAISDSSAYMSTLLWCLRNMGQLAPQFGHSWPDGGSPWSDTYATKDGQYITVCALEPKFYEELLQRLALTENPVFAQQWDTKLWPEAKRVMAETFASKTRDEWDELLLGTDVCYAPVLSLEEAAQHPHNQARGVFMEQDGVTQPAPTPKFGAGDSRAQSESFSIPELGQDTNNVLSQLGIILNAD